MLINLLFLKPKTTDYCNISAASFAAIHIGPSIYSLLSEGEQKLIPFKLCLKRVGFLYSPLGIKSIIKIMVFIVYFIKFLRLIVIYTAFEFYKKEKV